MGEPTSAVVCSLPPGTLLMALTPQNREDWVHSPLPVCGWVSAEMLRLVDAVDVAENMSQAEARLLRAMQHVRQKVTGPWPLGRCHLSTKELLKAVRGSPQEPLQEESPQEWARHTWLTLGTSIV